MRITGLVLMIVSALSAPAFAKDKWTLDSELSAVSFGSIKNDYTGESHVFSDISGGVEANGNVQIDIALNSVETNIDIRNERMLKHIFNAFESAQTATLKTAIDIKDLEKMKRGESRIFEVEAVLSFLGQEIDLYMDMFVMRLNHKQVLVTSQTPAFISTEDLGIDAGIDVLQGLAKLDSITRVTPLSARFIFER